MNMFKRNKKDKEYVLGGSLPSESAFSKASRGLTRRKKKQETEPEPTLDLSTALPEANEFRTSLLMPNLSARFSMLREQDDPNTKVGKASDDSVLFPKRASRLNVFQSNYLMDIAEVESIKSGFRPPFAENRQSAASDGYVSDDGASIMGRSRPGEGNNLFGGRQKMYMIASGSMRDLPHGMVGGKHMYDHDVAPSAFQRYRREQQETRDSCTSTQRISLPATDADDTDGAHSPSTAFSKNRGTQSSTNSGPSNRRTSTAATSMVLDSPVHRNGSTTAVTKTKEHDVNSPIEAASFATSPGTRRVRGFPERPSAVRLSGSRSATNLRDSDTPASPTPASRTATSDAKDGLAALEFGLGDVESRPTYSPPYTRAMSPPAVSDLHINNALAKEIQPNDRGKATAMGLFNKPAQQYNDKLFEERQIRVHEGRNASPDAETLIAPCASALSRTSDRLEDYSSRSVTNPPPQGNESPAVSPIPSQYPLPAMKHRTSNESMKHGSLSTSRARSKSSASVKEASVKARIESLIRRQNAELAAMEAQHLSSTGSVAETERVPMQLASSESALFVYPSTDAVAENTDRGQVSTPNTDIEPRPSLSDVHPALRDATTNPSIDITKHESSEPSSTARNSSSSAPESTVEDCQQSEQASRAASEELVVPGTQGLGLSGLVRTHLRQDSDRSSMYPPPSPATPAMPNSDSQFSMPSVPHNLGDTKRASVELGNNRVEVEQPFKLGPPPNTTAAMSQRAQQLLGLATAIRDAKKIELSQQSPEVERAYHQRNESTETEKEMQRFDEELAKRREKIEEKLQSVQENSRSRSPIAGFDSVSSGPRSRLPGRTNVDGMQNGKTMKMFGRARDQSSSRASENWQDQDRSRTNSSRQGSRPPTAQESTLR